MSTEYTEGTEHTILLFVCSVTMNDFIEIGLYLPRHTDGEFFWRATVHFPCEPNEPICSMSQRASGCLKHRKYKKKHIGNAPGNVGNKLYFIDFRTNNNNK